MFEGTAGSNNRERLLKGCLSYSLNCSVVQIVARER